MTKKEMAYEIISGTTLSGLSQAKIDKRINNISKETMEKFYNAYLESPQNANGYIATLFGISVERIM